jgi:hypothetical protein
MIWVLTLSVVGRTLVAFKRTLTKGNQMAIAIIAALVVLLFFGLGFALHLLWIVAVVLFVLWLVGFAVGRGESAGRRGWYGR